MARGRAVRLLMRISTALVLSSLPLIFVSADDKPASLNLPPFEKELYLSVTAKWAPNDCVDVTVVTNLPKGTVFVVGAQPRSKPQKLEPFQPVDRMFAWTKKLPIIATGSRIDVRNLFCGMVKSRGEGNWWYTNGLLLAAAVSAGSFWGFPKDQGQKQELRIGRYGTLLKGPLARPYLDEGTPKADAESETFILKPLPLLPGEDEKRPIGWAELRARQLSGEGTPLPANAPGREHGTKR